MADSVHVYCWAPPQDRQHTKTVPCWCQPEVTKVEMGVVHLHHGEIQPAVAKLLKAEKDFGFGMLGGALRTGRLAKKWSPR